MCRQVNKGQSHYQSLFGANSDPSSLISYRNYLPPHICDDEKIASQPAFLTNKRELLHTHWLRHPLLAIPITRKPSFCD